jgi:hypothetical protein
MNILTKVHRAWSHNLIMATFFRWLSQSGITIVPYGLYEESSDFLRSARIHPVWDQPSEIFILDQRNIELTKEFENLSEKTLIFFKQWNIGRSWIGLKYKGSIVAYGWFDPVQCNYAHLSFELKNNEGQVFNFHTARHMCGRDIAPFLRSILYTHLKFMDRNSIFSITEIYNATAMKLKKRELTHNHGVIISM